MHPVLGLVEDDALGAFEDFVGDLHRVAAKALAHLPAHGGLVVVVGGQAVHEHGVGACNVHQLLVDLVWCQVVDALGPHLHRLAHGHPDVGVQHVGPLGGLGGVLFKGDGGTGLGGDLLTLGHQLRVRLVLLGCAGGEMQAHLGAAHHQAVAHVVTGVAEVDEVDALQLAEVLPDGEEVGQDLGGVELVGQAVPHRHPGVVGQFLHDLLAVAAVLDAVKHAAQHPGGVGNGLLFADLAARRVQISHLHAQVVGSHFKAAAGAGGGLFKDQGNVLAMELVVGDAGLLFGLEVCGQVEQLFDLGGGIVQ